MHRVMVVMLLLVASTARGQQASAPQATRAEAVRKTRLAVLDVQYSGAGDRKTVEGLSALLASEVARRPTLSVVAGADLRALIGFERQKTLLGCTESSCMAELAGALGVAYLISSEVSKVGSTWLLSLALLDANRAAAVSRLTRKAYTDDQLVDETAGAVDELLKALPGAGPASPPGGEATRAERPAARPTGGSAALWPGPHRHDGGLLRFLLGFGSMTSSRGDLKLSGGSLGFAVAAGYALVDNLLLYAEVISETSTGPKFTRGGVTLPTTGTKTNNLTGLGAGAAWYFQGLNAYLSATGGAAVLTYMEPTGAGTSNEKTRAGPVLRLSAGKEWWVSTDWGLGVSLNLESATMRDKAATPGTFKSSAFSVALSATYN